MRHGGYRKLSSGDIRQEYGRKISRRLKGSEEESTYSRGKIRMSKMMVLVLYGEEFKKE